MFGREAVCQSLCRERHVRLGAMGPLSALNPEILVPTCFRGGSKIAKNQKNQKILYTTFTLTLNNIFTFL
jgi:hypothetical protein